MASPSTAETGESPGASSTATPEHVLRRRRACRYLIGAAALVPPAWLDRGPALCAVRGVTGRPCPGCGLTRAVVRTLHGDLRGATSAHLFGVPVAGVLAYWASGLEPQRDPKSSLSTMEISLAGVVGATWFLYAAARASGRCRQPT